MHIKGLNNLKQIFRLNCMIRRNTIKYIFLYNSKTTCYELLTKYIYNIITYYLMNSFRKSNTIKNTITSIKSHYSVY